MVPFGGGALPTCEMSVLICPTAVCAMRGFAVGIRLREARREEAIADRERPREPVVNGISSREATHGHRTTGLHEAVVALVRTERDVAGIQVWLGSRSSWHVDGMWKARIRSPFPSGDVFFGSPSRPMRNPSPRSSMPRYRRRCDSPSSPRRCGRSGESCPRLPAPSGRSGSRASGGSGPGGRWHGGWQGQPGHQRRASSQKSRRRMLPPARSPIAPTSGRARTSWSFESTRNRGPASSSSFAPFGTTTPRPR